MLEKSNRITNKYFKCEKIKSGFIREAKHQRSLGLFEDDLITLERAMHVLGTLVAKPRHFLLVTQSFFWKIISKTGILLYTDINEKRVHDTHQ